MAKKRKLVISIPTRTQPSLEIHDDRYEARQSLLGSNFLFFWRSLGFGIFCFDHYFIVVFSLKPS